MAKSRMDLSALVGKLMREQDGDVLREGVRVLAQALMDAEVTELIGAERHERTGERTGIATGFMRNLLALVPHAAREAVAAVVRTIFAQPDHASALAQLEKVVDGL